MMNVCRCLNCFCCKVHPSVREESSGRALCRAAREGDYVHLHNEKRDYGCDLNGVDEEDGGSTPLICACKFGHLQIVNWMVEHDVDPNIVDSENRTALLWSVKKGHLDIARSLLRHFKGIIDVDVQDKDGLAVLHIICMKRDITDEEAQLVEMILGVAKNINSVETSSGFTPLHYACRYEHEQIVEKLLRSNASASVADKFGYQVLHWACRANNFNIAKLICEYASDVNMNFKTKEGMTPMAFATTYGTIELTRYLAMKVCWTYVCVCVVLFSHKISYSSHFSTFTYHRVHRLLQNFVI